MKKSKQSLILEGLLPTKDDGKVLHGKDKILKAWEDGKLVSIKSFVGLSKNEISDLLDQAPKGAQISGIFSKRRDFYSVVKKEGGYGLLHATRIGTLSKEYEVYWSISGDKEPYFLSTIMKILKGTDEYYEMRGN